MTPDELHEAAERAFASITEKLEAMDDRFFPNGVAYDQQALSTDSEIIGFVLDLQSRPSPDFNIWQFLPDVSPKVYADLDRDFRRAMARTVERSTR